MMSLISSDFFARSPLLVFPILAMLLFMAVYVVSALRALRTAKPELDRLADLPLEQEQEVEHV